MKAIGRHNEHLETSRNRLIKGKTYKDASTACIIPTRGKVHARVIQSWFAMFPPMNQQFQRLFVWGMEVGEAYSTAIQQILDNPVMGKYKYILTLEEDNLPPPDGLVKLIQGIEEGPFDAIGGLYWTKGEEGQPMIYGNPAATPRNYIPQVPVPNVIQPCNGLGMGFTLFRLEMFRDERLRKPWFKTIAEYTPGQGVRIGTQDLQFFEDAAKWGYKFASDNRVLVGHYDEASDIIW